MPRKTVQSFGVTSGMLLVILFLFCDSDRHLTKCGSQCTCDSRHAASTGCRLGRSHAIDKTAKHVGHTGRLGRPVRHHFCKAILQNHFGVEFFHAQVEFESLLDCFLRDQADNFASSYAHAVALHFRSYRFINEFYGRLFVIGKIHRNLRLIPVFEQNPHCLHERKSTA